MTLALKAFWPRKNSGWAKTQARISPEQRFFKPW
jgi:hypothetical protein